MSKSPAIEGSGASNRMWVWLFFLFISAHFAIVLQKTAAIFLSTQSYTSFAAHRPYQLRWLMAPVLKFLVAEISDSKLQQTFSHLPGFLRPADAIAYVVIDAVAFFGALLAFHSLSDEVFVKDRLARRSAPILFVGAIYYVFCLNPNLSFVLPYDLPAVLFSCVCLLLAVRKQWIALFLVFPFAVMNRETILFVPIYLGVASALERDRAGLFRAAGLLVTWAVITLAESQILPPAETDKGMRLISNFYVLLKPWQWPMVLGLPAAIIACATASVRRSRIMAWQITAVLGWLILFSYANITELRAFADLVPLLAIALAPSAATCMTRGSEIV